jgi:signal transduction histidine kinase
MFGDASGVEAASRVISILEAQVEASGAGFLVVGPTGALLSHNDRFASQWGVPLSVLAQGSLHTLVDWLVADGGEVGQMVAELLASGNPPDAGEFSSSDGHAATFRTVLIRGDAGRVWAFHDASSTHHLATGLRDAGNLLRVLEAHADGVILEIDTDVCIVGIWAPNAFHFVEPDAKLQGRRLADVIGTTYGAELDAMVSRVFASGEPRTLEYTRDLHGERRVFTAHALLMPSSEDEPARVTVMIRDITERTRMQTKLLEAERLASVGLLAAGVAHEVNNPLTYTLLNLERIQTGLRELARRAPSDWVSQLLDAVRMSVEGGRRVQSIVNDLRRFSRLDHDDLRVPVDVRRVLDFAIDMSTHEIGERAKLVREFGEVPFVVASEGRLSQVFLNLIVNAAQSIREGNADDNEIRVVTRSDDSGRAVIEVSDTGEGMSASVMAHIFEPFYTTKRGVGMGLGLAICHGIATSLGGKLTVESELGRGSMFRLVLPPAEDTRPLAE